jgi:hypothetical protein
MGRWAVGISEAWVKLFFFLPENVNEAFLGLE